MQNVMTYEQMRDEYLQHVADLYRTVTDWTQSLDPNAELERQQITIREEPVEPYQAEVLVIKRPAHKIIRLVPAGRWIIGAEGRVDIKSDLGTETLVYVSDGEPHPRIGSMTENGKVLWKDYPSPSEEDVVHGWVFLQNRALGMLPCLDRDLFYRLLEVLGR